MNTYEDLLIEALDMVSAWDLPEEDLADAVNAQARLMAGILPEELVAQRDSFDSFL